MKGSVSGERVSGREHEGDKRIMYMNGVKVRVGREKLEEVGELARNGKAWHSIVPHITWHTALW